jgi:hypothetical protein
MRIACQVTEVESGGGGFRLQASNNDRFGQNSGRLPACLGSSSQRKHLSLVPQNKHVARASA